MSFLEKDLTAKFSHYIKLHPNQFQFSAAIEFKVAKGNTLNLIHDMQPQQIPSLIKAKYNILYHKISDMSANLKPFDSFILHNTKSFIAIVFNPKPRKPKTIYFVPINIVLYLQLLQNSISLNNAIHYSEFTITL